LHAIEELYFFRRYEEALEITEAALKGNLIQDFRKMLEDYRTRCQKKTQDTQKSEGYEKIKSPNPGSGLVR
jgi:hypothetical protein